jgi:hypothetical protein
MNKDPRVRERRESLGIAAWHPPHHRTLRTARVEETWRPAEDDVGEIRWKFEPEGRPRE